MFTPIPNPGGTVMAENPVLGMNGQNRFAELPPNTLPQGFVSPIPINGVPYGQVPGVSYGHSPCGYANVPFGHANVSIPGHVPTCTWPTPGIGVTSPVGSTFAPNYVTGWNNRPIWPQPVYNPFVGQVPFVGNYAPATNFGIPTCSPVQNWLPGLSPLSGIMPSSGLSSFSPIAGIPAVSTHLPTTGYGLPSVFPTTGIPLHGHLSGVQSPYGGLNVTGFCPPGLSTSPSTVPFCLPTNSYGPVTGVGQHNPWSVFTGSTSSISPISYCPPNDNGYGWNAMNPYTLGHVFGTPNAVTPFNVFNSPFHAKYGVGGFMNPVFPGLTGLGTQFPGTDSRLNPWNTQGSPLFQTCTPGGFSHLNSMNPINCTWPTPGSVPYGITPSWTCDPSCITGGIGTGLAGGMPLNSLGIPNSSILSGFGNPSVLSGFGNPSVTGFCGPTCCI